ncbi:MAG: GreA/GreB family elongation factor [Kiritimatiellae bacterium]|nr:GreA/GreB family elongation factor [Kiritimatiellia bacterium]
MTSKRSFRERQQQLDHILSVEIPKVARDIALARSYGDLRENHEYKAAKEAQTILFRRRDELMQELRRVTPSDFRGFSTDKAGVATTVTLSYEDGRQERYHILGAWDGDTARGIISSTSRMAEALIGHSAGETLVVPSEDGEAKATLTQVAALPAELLAYISQE